jgi:ABC-type multidrug transport system ATPase subunit
MTPPVITLRNVSRRFKKTQALSGIDLEVRPAEIFGIIGPDGAGKSSLLKIISGVMGFEGSVVFMGIDMAKNPEAVKGDLSFMPQGLGLNLYMELSVEENIDFFAAIKNVSDEKRDPLKKRLLDATGLAPFRGRYAKHLSGGMKQKLGICCSLISNPRVLLLDEPSTGVDPLSRRQLWELLYDFTEEIGTTLILATSYMDEAERCHFISFLHNGHTVFSGSPEQLTGGATDLEDAFFRMLLKDSELPAYDIPFEGNVAKYGPDTVRIRGAGKYFGDFKALDNVTLSVTKGEIFGFLGPNGAGKTTLLKCILSLLEPDEGDISVLGLKPGMPELKSEIGYMSQVFSLYGDLTVQENIELYASIYGIKGSDLRKREAWIFAVADLSGMERTQVRKLPLGVKQRLALGCAALNLPPLLILDEPTSGVDPVARRSFWMLIRALSERLGMTVLVTTHNLVEADFCDRIAVMNEGRIIAVDTPEALRRQFVDNSGEVFEFYPESVVNKGAFNSRGLAIAPFGKRFHIWKKGAEKDGIEAELEGMGVKYRYLKKIRPPMEDVFIYYLNKREGP